MYSVAIADDEIGIREGLRDLVNWNSLGFSLVGTFEDGEDLLPLLERQPPNLIVTDIRMARCSGLDLSSYIQKHRLGTKVVLISGYKEADLAMSAIKYGVKNYILKPVDLDELTACIEGIRTELDNEGAVHAQQAALDQACSKISDLLKLFFEEMMRGTVQNQRLVRRMFGLIYPGLSFDQSACFSLTLRIHPYDNFIRNAWSRSVSEMPRYIDGFSAAAQRNIEVRTISGEENRLLLFGLLGVQSGRPARDVIEEDIAILCEELRTAFGVQVDAAGLEVFASIPAMLGSIADAGEENLAGALEQLIRRQNQLYSVLLEGSCDDLARAVEQFSLYLGGMELASAQEVTKNLLHAVSSRLRNTGLTSMAALTLDEAFPALENAGNSDELRTVFVKTFSGLHLALHSGNNLWERAKSYIMEHIGEDISLEDISDHFYLSPSYFSRTFKAQTGETFVHFVSRCKMEYATTLLANTNLKVYDVCERVGYTSQRYFNKLFKEHTGMQPSGYRQRMHVGGAGNGR